MAGNFEVLVTFPDTKRRQQVQHWLSQEGRPDWDDELPEVDRHYFDDLEALEYPELVNPEGTTFVACFEFFEHYEDEDIDFAEMMLAMGADAVSGLIIGDDYMDVVIKTKGKDLIKKSLVL